MIRPAAIVIALVTAGPCRSGDGINVSYSFTPGLEGDGFDYPAAGLLDEFDGEDSPNASGRWTSPDGVVFRNLTGNTLWFDANHLIPGGSTGISGEALWSAPRPINRNVTDATEQMYLEFDPPVASVAFDFAWVVADDEVPATVLVTARNGPPENGVAMEVPLSVGFAGGGPFGGASGAAGRVSFDLESLAAGPDGVAIEGITHVDIEVTAVSTEAAVGQWAIDNLDLTCPTVE